MLKYLKQVLAACVLLTTATFAAAATDFPSINLPTTDTLVRMQIKTKTGCVLNISAQEGAMFLITNDDDVTLRFIVARDDKFGNRFMLRQVLIVDKVMGGLKRQVLSVDKPVEFGQVSANMDKAGVTWTAMVATSKIPANKLSKWQEREQGFAALTFGTLRMAGPIASPVKMWKTGGPDFGSVRMYKTQICPEQPCDGKTCCTFTGCDGKQWRVCGGAGTCGDDGCSGGCCV